jgi:hypothetical protein
VDLATTVTFSLAMTSISKVRSVVVEHSVVLNSVKFFFYLLY